MALTLKSKIALLRYPRIDNLSFTDPAEVAAFVAFIEDRHVRTWEIEQRACLRKPGPAWLASFEEYLRDIGCPLLGDTPVESIKMLEYLSWLVGHAIGLGYEDRADEILDASENELAFCESKAGSAGSSGVATAGAAAAAEAPPAVTAAIRELAAMLHVQVEGRNSLQVLQAAHRVIRQRVLPAVAVSATESAEEGSRTKAAAQRRGPGLTPKELLDLQFPLGFSMGSDVADRAAAILRMLYIADLRELQDAVNDIVVTVQEFTANPKTDASLGQVGR